MKYLIPFILSFSSLWASAQVKTEANGADSMSRKAMQVVGDMECCGPCRGDGGVTLTAEKPIVIRYILDDEIPISLVSQMALSERYDLTGITRTTLLELPCRYLVDALTLFPGMYQRREGSDPNIYGARSDGILYVVDGMYLLR